MKNNLPTIPVTDLAIHPRENDLVVASHGRGIFITDISPLQEISEKVLAEDVHLFKPEPKTQRPRMSVGRRLSGHRHFTAPNEPVGIVIYYYLKEKPDEEVQIIITDAYGKKIIEFKSKVAAGMNSFVWNMRKPPTKEEQERMQRMPERFRRFIGQTVSPGEYVVILKVGEKELKQIARILEP